MTSFLEIIRFGIRAKGNTERQESEAKILEMRRKHPNDFFKECGKNFSDESLDDLTRETIATILNRSLKEMVISVPEF